MGYYIETPESRNKARQLVELHGAELVLSPESFDFSGLDALICVVENDDFDSAEITFTKRELNRYIQPDDRAKVWLKMPKSKVIELCPFAKDEFNRPESPEQPMHKYAI